MQIQDVITLGFWNSLVRDNLANVLMVLTAACLVLVDRHIRKIVQRMTVNRNRFFRFIVFLGVVSFGYAALAFIISYVVRKGLFLFHGAYMAPMVLGLLLIIAWEAQRQKHV